MNSSELADVLVRAVLTFDPSQHQTRDEELLETRTSADVVRALRAHLSENECAWLYRRRTGTQIRQTLTTSSVILYGEAGTGKTSVLREMQCAAVTNPATAVPLLIIDLHQVEGQVQAATRRERKRRILTEFTISKLSQALANDLAEDDVQSTLFYRLASGNEFFKPFRTHLKRSRKSGLLASRESFSGCLDAEITSALFEKCYSQYLESEDELSQHIRELSALAETPGRRAIVIAFDNVDRLDTRAQDECASIARSMSATTDTLLPVILTCRTKNMRKLKDIVDTLAAEPFAARPLPDIRDRHRGNPQKWAVAGIFRRRLDVLKDDLFWDGIESHNSVPRDLRANVNLVLRRVDQVLEALWPTNLNERVPDHSVELGMALTKWHRGNVRDISISLYSIIRSINVDPALMPSGAGDVAGKRIRNLLYRDILGQVSRFGDLDGGHPGDIDDYIQLFQAHPEPSSGGMLPFYFLKFRILRYLAARQEGLQVTRTELARRFSFYGVDPSSVETVVTELVAGSAATPALLLEVHGRSASRVEILDNGRYLVNNLVTKCEYLYASAISIPTVFEALASNPLFPRFKRMVGLPPRDETKVLVSALFLLDYLMPRFHDEHPYLLRNDFDGRERARIERFRADFGFDSSNWLINQLVHSIRSHARESGATIPREIDLRLTNVLLEGGRLDRMLRGPSETSL